MLAVAYFLAILCVVSAIPSPEIVRNSDRLAQNLPPLPPKKFIRTLPGGSRNGDVPTPAYDAKRSSTSSVPVSYYGRIEVREGDSVVGYLENSSGSGGKINLTGDKHSDLHVAIRTTSTGTGPFDITATNPHWKGSPLLGAGTYRHSPELKKGSANTIGLISVKGTPRNSPPVHSHGGITGESRIWSINPHTKEIKAHWINSDGSKPTTEIAYDVKENSVFFVGDIKAYNRVFEYEPASAVRFYLVK